MADGRRHQWQGQQLDREQPAGQKADAGDAVRRKAAPTVQQTQRNRGICQTTQKRLWQRRRRKPADSAQIPHGGSPNQRIAVQFPAKHQRSRAVPTSTPTPGSPNGTALQNQAHGGNARRTSSAPPPGQCEIEAVTALEQEAKLMGTTFRNGRGSDPSSVSRHLAANLSATRASTTPQIELGTQDGIHQQRREQDEIHPGFSTPCQK